MQFTQRLQLLQDMKNCNPVTIKRNLLLSDFAVFYPPKKIATLLFFFTLLKPNNLISLHFDLCPFKHSNMNSYEYLLLEQTFLSNHMKIFLSDVPIVLICHSQPSASISASH